MLSEDDPSRHARGFRNRWRYTLTGAVLPGLPIGCAVRPVQVRVMPGGLVDVSLGAFGLLLMPGDPAAQDAIARNAGACELNHQLVNVREVAGRWQILIEEPDSMPYTRETCGRPAPNL